MEQRLAEFREARKRAGLAAQPSTSSRNAQTSGEKAEVAATPKAAPGWLTRFLVLVRKPRPANARAPPSLAQEAAQPGSSSAQPPRSAALPPPWDQSPLINVTFLKVASLVVLLGLFVELEIRPGTRGLRDKKKGAKSALLCVQPRLRGHPGHPDSRAVGTERELQFRPLAGR
uniref:Uncharacterized protein n=1 Tax=Sciurus vulgaris TaxID=55149 RepID=A0A8D2AT47_SCIVU